MSAFFETVAKDSNNPKLAANWVKGELSGSLNYADLGFTESPVSAQQLAGMIVRIADNSISGKIAKQVFEAMWQGEGTADKIIQAKGLKQVSDSGALEKIVVEVLDGNPAMIEDFINTDKSKRKKKLGGFMGQIMKASKGQANPQQVSQILLQKLNALL
jgi:aspartyl-tRNA(Asn)/glutamyl-tRNA(Gln) amidotransferase subunit B